MILGDADDIRAKNLGVRVEKIEDQVKKRVFTASQVHSLAYEM